MKQVRFLIAGFAVGMLMALTPSCSPPPAGCTAANCTGCCDSTNKCQGGSSTNACGKSGQTCSACGANQTCQANACVTGGVGGGTGGSGGGTAGGAGGGSVTTCAQSCAGCCDSAGACQGGSTAGACGNGGATCAACTGTAVCTTGTCVDPSCTGCVKNGVCQTTLNDTTCGMGGIACNDCAAMGGATCTVATGVCTGGTCGGCRNASGACLTGNTNGACGTSGVACVACTGTNVCSNGACVSGSGGGAGGSGGGQGGGTAGGQGGGTAGGSGGGTAGGSGGGTAGGSGGGTAGGSGGGGGVVCGPGSLTNPCSNGCCASNGVCQLTSQQGIGSCGIAGAACAPCQLTQTCNSGVCTNAAVAVGSPCATATDCSSLGVGAKCKLTTTRGDGTYTGGFCTLNCTGAAQGTCPVGNRCTETAGLDLYGEYESICLNPCTSSGSQSTCRTGYSCYFGTAVGMPGNCWLGTVPAFDAGTPSNKLGYACATDTQCINPPNPSLGFCYPEVLNAQPTEFSGGYCMSSCENGFGGVNGCGPNGVCLDLGNAANPFLTCLGTCTTPSGGKLAQRPGGGAGGPYSCYGLTFSDGGPTPFGYVYPSCDAPNNGCGPAGNGFTCNTTNGYCCPVDGGGCFD